MTRWANIGAVGGFLIVLAFVAQRFSRFPASWTEVSGDIVITELLFVLIVLMFLGILRGAYLLWARTLRKQPRGEPSDSQPSLVGRWPFTARVAVLSLVLGIAGERLTGMRTPGILGLDAIFPLDPHNSIVAYFALVLYFLMPIVVDGIVCFMILWGGYRLLNRRERSV